MTSLYYQQDISALNTLALPCCAEAFLTLNTLADVALAKPFDRRFVLGGGSNVVLPESLPGLVIHVALKGKRLLGSDDDAWYVAAAGGESWHDFVMWTLEHGWPGLENLALIPGTVGAAPIQNIGAYGLEVSDYLHEVVAIDLKSGDELRYANADCHFAYRNSRFKNAGWHLSGNYLIHEVIFRLPKIWRANTNYQEIAQLLAERAITVPTAHDIAAAVIAIRQRKLPDPMKLPNAGSFFHNPIVDAATADALTRQFPGLPCYPQTDGKIKLAAGWMIEQSGWKGKRLGPVGMYEKQALVLVNHGGGTRKDVVQLLREIQHAVSLRFGVRLTAEPVFAGETLTA